MIRGIKPELVGDVFYSKLFLEMPGLKKMFDGPMVVQHKKLIDMISLMVGRLDRLDELSEDVRQLAIRHVGYGVRSGHYGAVGHALLWTLQQGLGKDWTEEVKNAWTHCYAMIAATMEEASAP